MIPLSYFLTLGALLLAISLAGMIINRKNLIVMLMCVELIFLAVNMNFIAFSSYLQQGAGEIFVFFILAVAAAEAAIGLAILILLYRKRGDINIASMNQLKG